MMKEVAYRLSAPYKENMFSIMHKPWFDFSIYYKFRRTNFEPVPSVDVVMLRFKKRNEPLLKWSDITDYQRFIKLGFGHGQPIRDNLKKQYGKQKVLHIMKTLNLHRDIKPGFLSLDHWIKLYSLSPRRSELPHKTAPSAPPLGIRQQKNITKHERRVQDSNMCTLKGIGSRNSCNWPLCEPSTIAIANSQLLIWYSRRDSLPALHTQSVVGGEPLPAGRPNQIVRTDLPRLPCLVPLEGIEPPTDSLEPSCSIR